MAAIVKKPDALSLSGNMIPFVVFVGAGSVSFTLLKGTETLVKQSYECGPDGNVTIDVRDVIENSLSFTLNTASNTYQQTNYATFKAIIDDLSYEFTVVRAGVANLADTPANFLKLHFLTWQPRVKQITYYTPEWLTYYAVTSSSIKLKATFPDGTNTVISLCTIAPGTAMTVNVQYAVIAGLLGKRYPTHYEIWAESVGKKVSESLYYAYAESAGEDEQWFLFENSLGGIDSFRAFGVKSLNAEHEHQIAEMGDVRQEFRIDTERKYTKNTGHLDDYQRRWLLDFFPSRAKYIYEAAAIRKIIVSEDNTSYKSSDLPSSYTFTFQFAELSAYLNLQRNEEDIPSEIVVPDLSSPDFILPPRLIEFPRVQLSEGVLIPAFEPHSDKPTVTTYGAIHEGIYNSVTEYVELVTEEIGKTLEEIKNGGFNGSGGSGGVSFPHLTSSDMLTVPSDDNAFTSLRTLVEIKKSVSELDNRFLRKDIDDIAAGNITFLQSIHSKDFSISGQGWQINQNGESWFDTTFIRDNIYSDAAANSFAHENGFKIWADGDAWFRNLYVKKDAMFQGNLSSPFFVSGFPAGIGWALTWRDVVNAAGVAAKKAHFETDDITVRGILRVYEMVISQLLGENGTRLTTDMMKVKSVDIENRIIYLDTEEGALYNPFWTDDILMVQRFNGMPTPENDYYVTRQYELVVEETHIGSLDDGEERVDWIKYKNFVGDETQITDRDTLVRVDNLTNSDRKGVIKQTSVEPGSPYMDIMYGMKTDPENAVRARYGRLEGLITPYWGTLEGYGIMCDNAYLKGRFMLHNGEDVFQKFEIIDGKLESEISAIRAEISDKDNCLSNSSFASDLEKWETSSEVSFYTVNSKFLYFNSNFYSYKNKLGAITQDGGRKALRLKNNTIKQLNEFIRNKPEEQLKLEDGTLVWPLFYISFRYKVLSAGTLTVGFSGQDLYHTEELEESTSYEDKEYSGRWDGTGDFSLSFTGDIYIYSLAMTSNPLEDFKAQFLTRIAQTEKEILLHAQSIQEVSNRVTTTEGNISVMAGDINIWASRVTAVEGRVSSAEHSIINVLPSQISAISSRVTNTEDGVQRLLSAGFITVPEGNILFARRDNIISAINQSPEVITIDAGLINLTGRVTFDYFSSDLQDRIRSKVDSSSLGGLAYKDKVEQAMKDETIIVGGYIKTSLIKVDEVLANAATIGRFRIEQNTLTWRDWGDGALIKLGFSYSYSRNTCITVKADFMGIGITALNPDAGCAIFASMYSSPSYPGTTYLYAMYIDGDLVITRGNIIVRSDGASNKGAIQADRMLPQNGWSGSFKDRTVKVENGIITNVS